MFENTCRANRSNGPVSALPTRSLLSSLGDGMRIELWERMADPDTELTAAGGPADALRFHLETSPRPVGNGREDDEKLPHCPAGACSMLSYSSERRWRQDQSLGMIVFRIPRAPLAKWARAHGFKRFQKLEFTSGEAFIDPVLKNLANAILPSLRDAQDAAEVFTDFVMGAVLRHVVGRFGSNSMPVHRGGLAIWQVRAAKELMASRMDSQISLAEMAARCDLSVSYFVKAFRVTVGLTPHQWLIAHRVGQAREMLQGQGASLADVATSCGFADQSHFTRMFTRAVGTSPGAWRKQTGISSCASRPVEHTSGDAVALL